MAIPETQLETWSHLGSVTQSASTYNTIKNVLNDNGSPYFSKSFTIFLQGSYGNATNVFKDSDVDIVIRLDQTYYWGNSLLTEVAKTNLTNTINPATYSLETFKTNVSSWLIKKFGSDVSVGTKAINIKASGARRDADVLVCASYRLYRADSNGADDKYDEGICFFKSDGTLVHNFPKQHADNCTTKHQVSIQWFKPVVRIYKNMRNQMADEKIIKGGLAPSYFIEGMLWNVPTSLYGKSYDSSFVKTYNWIVQTDKTQLACASDLHWLVRDNVQTCWPAADFDKFMSAAGKYWKEWGT